MTDEAEILGMIAELKAGQVKLAGILERVLALLEENRTAGFAIESVRDLNRDRQTKHRVLNRAARKASKVTDRINTRNVSNVTPPPEAAPVVGSLVSKELKTKTKSKDSSLLGLVSLRDYQHSVNDGFDAFWKEYPRRVGKAAAFASWKRMGLSEASGDVMLGLAREKKTEWRNRDLDKIPHPATWLNQRRWEDEVEAPSMVSDKTRGNLESLRQFAEGAVTRQRRLEERTP